MTIAANKVDRAGRARIAATLQGAEELGVSDDIFPVSARTGAGLPTLVDHLVSQLPAGPFYFAAAQHSDQSPTVLLAELVREQVLARTREEVPHAVEVEVLEIDHPRPDLVRIEAVVLTETESQKGILIGAGGRMIKSIGMAARRAIERELDTKVHLQAVGQSAPSLARRRTCARPTGNRVEVPVEHSPSFLRKS